MASDRREKDGCSDCATMVGIFVCRGCSGNFCLDHTIRHRDLLQKSMNGLVDHYEKLKVGVKEEPTGEYQRSLHKAIDQWEEKSVADIHQFAEITRSQVSKTLRTRSEHFDHNLDELGHLFEQARRDGGFYEQDLEKWAEMLKLLQQGLNDQREIQLRRDEKGIPLVSRISFGNTEQPDREYFEEYPKPQEPSEYSTGQFIRRFKIAQYRSDSLVLFGIISKAAANYADPYKNPTFYGWAKENHVYLGGGVPEPNYKEYVSDYHAGDVITLTIDCDQRTLNFHNQRTDRSYRLSVDLQKCPFPWLLNIHLLDGPQ